MLYLHVFGFTRARSIMLLMDALQKGCIVNLFKLEIAIIRRMLSCPFDLGRLLVYMHYPEGN
jgi:hypothetical protein